MRQSIHLLYSNEVFSCTSDFSASALKRCLLNALTPHPPRSVPVRTFSESKGAWSWVAGSGLSLRYFRLTSFISKSSKKHMLRQRNHLIQAGETCSPDEQLTDHLLRSSAYECNVCWGGWMRCQLSTLVSSKAKQQPGP